MGPSLQFCLPTKRAGVRALSMSSWSSSALRSTPEQGFTFQSISNQSLQFGLSFHPVLLSELQTQPPAYLNMKHTLLSQICGKMPPDLLCIQSGGSQAKLSLKVSSPNKSHMWTIPCTLLGLAIKSVGCHATLNTGWGSESVGNCISLAAWG